MKKVVFIIDSKYYSFQLLTHYVERNTDCRAFNFFSPDEVLLYLNLKPNIIIYGLDEEAFSPQQLVGLASSSHSETMLMGVNKKFVRIDRLSNSGEMVLEDTLPYRDIYRDLHAMCFASQV